MDQTAFDVSQKTLSDKFKMVAGTLKIGGVAAGLLTMSFLREYDLASWQQAAQTAFFFVGGPLFVLGLATNVAAIGTLLVREHRQHTRK